MQVGVFADCRSARASVRIIWEPGSEPSTILVVDDNTAVREVLADQLQVQGDAVVTAGDGLGAVE